MPTTDLANNSRHVVPFVGRGKEVAHLQQLHARRKHVLILGPAGVGKSALIYHVASRLPLLVCPQSVRLTEIYGALESQLGPSGVAQRLLQRKNRLLRALGERGQPAVFDDLVWTTPKLSSFLESVMERVPVWLCARSEHPWDIGHFWPLLVRFERVELQPFHLGETRALVKAAVQGDFTPNDTLNAAGKLHRLAHGNPGVLCELLTVNATRRYDLSKESGLQLLELDRRIRGLSQSDEGAIIGESER